MDRLLKTEWLNPRQTDTNQGKFPVRDKSDAEEMSSNEYDNSADNKMGTEQGSSTVNSMFSAALFSRFKPQTTKGNRTG